MFIATLPISNGKIKTSKKQKKTSRYLNNGKNALFKAMKQWCAGL
jgi:hypothetical protein